MSAGPINRRALMAGAGAALGAAALPAGASVAAEVENPATGLPAAAPPAFDAAGYVADLKAIGCRPYAFRAVHSGGILGPWRYGVAAPEGSGFGRDHLLVMRRWMAAIDACPGYGQAVAAYIVGGGA